MGPIFDVANKIIFWSLKKIFIWIVPSSSRTLTNDASSFFANLHRCLFIKWRHLSSRGLLLCTSLVPPTNNIRINEKIQFEHSSSYIKKWRSSQRRNLVDQNVVHYENKKCNYKISRRLQIEELLRCIFWYILVFLVQHIKWLKIEMQSAAILSGPSVTTKCFF